MRLTLLAALSASCSIVLAQPTLTGTVNAPWIGDSYTLYRTAWVDPGNSGPTSWDFSTLAQTSTRTVEYVDPDPTPLGDSLFTTADLASDDQLDHYLYYTVDAAALSLAGIDSMVGSIAVSVPYSDPAVYLQYPCTFGTTWVDNLAGSYTAFGTSVNRTGTVAGNADAHGPVQMPYGTVYDALRVHLQENVHDQALVGSIDATMDRYSFYKSWLRVPFLEIVTTTLSLNGGAPTSFQYVEWLDGGPVGLAGVAGGAFELHVWPNPADDLLSIVFANTGPMDLELIDAFGRTVKQERTNGSPTATWRVAALPAGPYLLRASDARGLYTVRRITVR